MAMGDEGEKTCPLCTEEMDLTDQQLRPCKCGYEICVWCWHQIMDMVEKDDTEGRCPACRTPYDKEKIVGMAVNCERLVAGIDSERRQKSQRAKSKTPEGRKHLSDVRVIQRNLVYTIGIPVTLADENTLERKEFFGQYGKVLKVSVSRPASGDQQSTKNSTCNVYITYSKEEEAVRCIQSVHGFSLEGSSLRACYGTTKYCHTWLRNMPCNNPDCLYLHEIGTQEDSFTKDEIVSAYTRSRVLQIVGASNNAQRRSGNILPPPVDDYCINAASADYMVNYLPNNPTHQSKGSPPNDCSGKSCVLPATAAWGSCVSSCWKPSSSIVNCQEHDLLKDDAFSNPLASSTVAGNFPQASAALHTAGETSSLTEENHNLSSISRPWTYSTQCIDNKNKKPVEKPSELVQVTNPAVNSEDLITEPSVESGLYGARRNSHSILFTENTDDVIQVENCDYGQQKNSVSGHLFSTSPGKADERSCQYSANDSVGIYASKVPFNWRTEFQKHASPSEDSGNVEVLPVNDVLKLTEPLTPTFLLSSCSPSENSNHSSHHDVPAFRNGLSGPRSEYAKEDDLFLRLTNGRTTFSIGSRENDFNITTSESDKFGESNVEKLRYLGKSDGYAMIDDKIASLNLGESTIISNIFSMDFDPWDGSSTHSFTELLKGTDLQNGYCRLSNLHKPQDSSQSRFSFARQDEFMDRATCPEPSSDEMKHLQKSSAVLDVLQNRESFVDRRLNGSIEFNLEDFLNPFSSHSSLVSNKASVSRSQNSVPPGFAVPNRAFPPGFSSQQRMDHGNQLSASASMPTNQHQLPTLAGDVGDAGDIEFIDPAILAVSKERFPLGGISNSSWNSASFFQAQQLMPKNDARIQLLVQPPKSFTQNLVYSDCAADMFARLNDAHIQTQLAGHLRFEGNGIEHLSSFQQSRNLGMPNNPWGSFNAIQTGANLAMAGILRNDIPNLDKCNSDYDELGFQRYTPLGDLYSRAFGM